MPINPELLQRLHDNDPTLMYLYFQDKDNPFTHEDAVSLSQALMNNTTVKRLVFSEQNLGDAGVSAIADALLHNTTLTELEISNDNIKTPGCTALTNLLKSKTSLEYLDLPSNSIDDNGAKALAEGLAENTHLKQLNLYKNWIADSGAIALAQALKKNDSLTGLSLPSNYISGPGSKALAGALYQNTKLTALGLESNPIPTEGAIALAQALKDNSALTNFGISITEITSTGLKKFAESLETNTNLRIFCLLSGRISDGDAAEFLKAFNENATLVRLLLRTNSTTNQSKALQTTVAIDLPKRNVKIQRIADVIQLAWLHNIKDFSNESLAAYVKDIDKSWKPNRNTALDANSPLNEIIEAAEVKARNKHNPDELIASILQFKYSQDGTPSMKAETLIKNLRAFAKTYNLDLDELPDKAYPKEFLRFITGKVDAMNIHDTESQLNALTCLAHPYTDSDLQAQANVELISLLNNAYFSPCQENEFKDVLKHFQQRKALDILLIGLAVTHPKDRDFFFLARGAFTRLTGEKDAPEKPTDDCLRKFKTLIEQKFTEDTPNLKALMHHCRVQIAEASSQEPSLATGSLFSTSAQPKPTSEVPSPKSPDRP